MYVSIIYSINFVQAEIRCKGTTFFPIVQIFFSTKRKSYPKQKKQTAERQSFAIFKLLKSFPKVENRSKERFTF